MYSHLIMEGQKGKLIVIEGTDGSGKGVQTKLLTEHIQKIGRRTSTASFPQYGKKSSGLIEEYLNGKYGNAHKVSPYIASLFYALDRFDLARELKNRLAEGYVVILDRYVDSNAGHQGGKITDPGEREKFIAWLYDIEYRILEIPVPDITIILHVPAAIGQELIAKKQQRLYIEGGRKKDEHERNLTHLHAAENTYLWLAQKFPRDHVVVECVEQGALLSPEIIHERVWNKLKKII